MTDWPKYPDRDATGQAGVHLFGFRVVQDLGWIFRDKPVADLGIDGEVEVRKDSLSRGRLFSVQIKTGESYLKEETTTGYVYRGDRKHLNYWSNYSTPVVIVLCDLDSAKCWWQSVDLQLVRFHEVGWSLEVPFSQEVTTSSAEQLEKVAHRVQKRDIAEVLFRDWLGWSFEHKLRLASAVHMHRDFYWHSGHGILDEGDEYFMYDFLMAGIDGFDEAEVEQTIEAAELNVRHCGFRRLVLGFVAESLHWLKELPPVRRARGVTIDSVPLLLDLRSGPQLSEVGQGDDLIEAYEGGKALDGWAEYVTRRVRTSESRPWVTRF